MRPPEKSLRGSLAKTAVGQINASARRGVFVTRFVDWHACRRAFVTHFDDRAKTRARPHNPVCGLPIAAHKRFCTIASELPRHPRNFATRIGRPTTPKPGRLPWLDVLS